MQNKLIAWFLFDSGGGSYSQAVETHSHLKNKIEYYAIGIDMEAGTKNATQMNFINCNLADLGEYFGESTMWDTLDKLPKPDIILASAPCESYSMASAIKGGGNTPWKRDEDRNFIVRPKSELDAINDTGTPYKRIFWKSIYNRLNGEACCFNTTRIIERYEPKVWVMENPQTSQMWDYLANICDFHGFKNVANYHAYDMENFTKKPTVFYSNIKLNLKTSKEKPKLYFKKSDADKVGGKDISRSYNVRSLIPIPLIEDMLVQIIKGMVVADKKGVHIPLKPTKERVAELSKKTKPKKRVETNPQLSLFDEDKEN